MKELNHIKTVLLVFLLIVSLWFVLGFIMPVYIFKDLKESGVFGDGFGSVNALFSGLGFLALSYTIILQIEDRRNDRRQRRFEMLINLAEDIKEDINSLVWGNEKGLNAINAFRNWIKPEIISDVHYKF